MECAESSKQKLEMFIAPIDLKSLQANLVILLFPLLVSPVLGTSCPLEPLNIFSHDNVETLLVKNTSFHDSFTLFI